MERLYIDKQILYVSQGAVTSKRCSIYVTWVTSPFDFKPVLRQRALVSIPQTQKTIPRVTPTRNHLIMIPSDHDYFFWMLH